MVMMITMMMFIQKTYILYLLSYRSFLSFFLWKTHFYIAIHVFNPNQADKHRLCHGNANLLIVKTNQGQATRLQFSL